MIVAYELSAHDDGTHIYFGFQLVQSLTKVKERQEFWDQIRKQLEQIPDEKER